VHLATETLEYFNDEYTGTLTDDEISFLESLEKRSTKEANEEDKEFYEKHMRELSEAPTLRAKWDKFVYGQPIECTDFLVGLLEAVQRLYAQSDNIVGQKKLRIYTQKRQRKSVWLDLNHDVGLFFCTRYKGLNELTQQFIEWDTHWLFKFDQLLQENKDKVGKKKKKNTSMAKSATQIKFYVDLTTQDDSIYTSTPKVHLIWQAQPNGVGFELPKDLERIAKYTFQQSSISKNPVSKKGKLQSISLDDVSTLQPVFGQNKGSFIGTYDKSRDISKIFLARLKTAFESGRMTEVGYSKILSSWEAFKLSYEEAIKGWLEIGINSSALVTQSLNYEEFLKNLNDYAKGDINREKLWKIILDIGNVQVNDSIPKSIITPWHPMRLASIATKVTQLCNLIQGIVTSEEVNFGDSNLFFNDIKSELIQPYYPEVTVGYKGNQPFILSITDTVNDYSLMELPTYQVKEMETNEDPTEASNNVMSLVQRYLDIQPHEATNMGLVLYNCDSTRLPQAIVDKLSTINYQSDDLRCQVVLKHRNKEKLSNIYTKMVAGSDNPDILAASEVSKDFLARLRIGVLAHETPIKGSSQKPYDIVFLQGVVSRLAKFNWTQVKVTDVPEILSNIPPRWSKRKPSSRDDLKSATYLVSPNQPKIGWTYLNSLKCLTDSKDLEEDTYYLPTREISFQHEETKTIFDEAHQLGDWVANFDDLLDRRLLKNYGVSVIKYAHNQSNGPNLIVSTKSSLNLLKILVIRRLKTLNLGIDDIEFNRLADKLIEDANQLSGDIVLRAAKRGNFASELIGVVLSRALIHSEVDKDQMLGWYFLDDYASWLGKKEEQIADILALTPREVNGKYYLQIYVSESKYIDVKNLSNSRKTSQNQLRDTVKRMEDALLGLNRLDKELWLSRISDLLLEGIEFNHSSMLSLEEWRQKIRSGEVSISIRGYSHVFLTNNDERNFESELVKVPHVENCYQEVFNKDKLRKLLLAYLQESSLQIVREEITDEFPWKEDLHHDSQEGQRKNDSKDSIEKESKEEKQDIETIDGPNVHKGDKGGVENPKVESIENQVSAKGDDWATPALREWINDNLSKETGSSEEDEWLKEAVRSLKTALMTYNLQSKVLETRLTPNAAIIKLKGSDRLKIDDIEKKRSELLTTHALNIINIVPRPGEIVIFISRPKREVISLADVWNDRKLQSNELNMSFVIGTKEVDGELLYLNLGGSFKGLEQHAPHTLIAGATGSGKSVLLQNLILDICVTNSEELAHIYLIDPKYGVDYSNLEELPHLKEGIITEQERASEILESLVNEMESRYKMFRDLKVNNLKDYNKKVSGENRLPLIFLIHDEFADWMLVEDYKKTVISSVQRLGIKARAAGIHLIFAAQRPDKDVLPIQLRDNLGNRLILRVESKGTSEITLGEKGAELLLGKGHLSARLSGESELIYAQVPFLSSEDLFVITQKIKNYRE
jgi:S-DNA-T family DNA segregation ATPase FtsK/SpoIIIE